MKHLAGLASLVTLAALAGCGGNRANQPDLTTQTVETRGHGIAFNRSATGSINGVYDRSDSSQGGSLVTTLSNGIATSEGNAAVSAITIGRPSPRAARAR